MSETYLQIVTEYDVVKVKLTKEGQQRLERLQAVEPNGACLGCERPFEEGEQKKCGQCVTCYNGALYAIGEKKTTRQSLIRDGKMLAPTKGGRKPVNTFTRSLSEL